MVAVNPNAGIIQKNDAEKKAVAKKASTVTDLLQSERFLSQVQKALPKTMDSDNFIRSAVNEFRLNPTLQKASAASVFGYFLQAAALGLKPASVLGQCYPVPFFNKKTGQNEATFLLGYRGMLALARRSGEVSSVECNVVHEKDKFHWAWEGEGLNRYFEETDEPDPGPMVAVYCIVRFRDGGYQGCKMSKSQVDDIRRRSKSGSSGPWVTDYEAMAMKTCFRRLFKWLPINIETQEKVEQDGTVAKWDKDEGEELEINYVQMDDVDPETGEITAEAEIK